MLSHCQAVVETILPDKVIYSWVSPLAVTQYTSDLYNHSNNSRSSHYHFGYFLYKMLNSMPAELLQQILSHLVSETSQAGLTPISCVNQRLSATTRDYRAQLLRSRLQSISHIELLMRIWSPPLFFRLDRGSGQTSGGYLSCPADFHDLLCDSESYNRIDRYLETLERYNWVSGRIAEFVVTIIDFSHCRSSSEARSLVKTAVIELWSAHVRYGHDVDGWIMQIRDEYGPEYYVQDAYVQTLPSSLRNTIMKVYHALCQYLKHPFYPSPSMNEGLWLYKHILRVGVSIRDLQNFIANPSVGRYGKCLEYAGDKTQVDEGV